MAQEEYEHKLLDLARVARVVKGGRRFSFRATVVCGNRKGNVGVGVAKGKDVAQAIEKALHSAKRNLISVFIVEGTIPHATEVKYASSKLFIKPVRFGKGIVAGGAVRAVCDLAGIERISAKLLSRSKNKLNIARATIKALQQLESSKQMRTKKEGGKKEKSNHRSDTK